MSQSKNTDNTKANSNSDEIARSIIQPMVDQAAGDSKGGGTHSKPPLPHNNGSSKKDSKKKKTEKSSSSSSSTKKKSEVDCKIDQFQRSSSNRNIVFHPDHPEKIYDLSSTSTAQSQTSPNRTPDPTDTTSPDSNKKKTASSSSLISIPKKSSHNTSKLDGTSDHKNNNDVNNDNKESSNGSNSNKSSSNRNGSTNNNNKSESKSNGKLTKIDENNNNEKSSNNNKKSSSDNSKSSSSSKNGSSSSTHLSREAKRERRRRLEDPNCFPKRFEVQVQARVRVGQDLSSQHLTDLPEGSVVTVEEIIDRRARISRPLCGWLSVTSKFGARIILPTNSKYSKIGGKVVFNPPIQGPTMKYTHAKVVDYNEDNGCYKVRFDDNTSRLIDIEAANITFISQHKAVKVQKPLDGTAPTFTLQTSQAFFNQFFCKDYPQYQAQSSSTTRHMDISPVAVQQAGSRYGYPPHPGQRGQTGGMPPIPGQHGHPSHGQYPPHPGDPSHRGPNGLPHPHGHGPPPPHGRRGPHGQYPPHPYPPPPHGHHGQHPPHPGQLPPHQQHPPYGPPPHGHGPRGQPPHPYPPPGPQGHHPYPPPGSRGGVGPVPPHGHGQQPGPDRGQQPPHTSPTQHTQGPNDGNNGGRGDGGQNADDQNNKKDDAGKTPAGKASEEFVNKVKEIERRIIQHLHQRGYDESHPDYHRYLQKAKELAIQKAGKEREKMLAQQREQRAAQSQGGGPSKGVSRSEYEQYMRYRQEKQKQHALEEAERRRRLEDQRRRQNEADRAKGGSSSKKSGGSVKGLIVLRGLPGSGKTTLAKKLAQRSKNARICTEDRYHWSGKEDGVGEYKFQPQLVFLAREWCTKEIRECIQSNVNLIILDNHNARISMYEDHIQYAVEHGYRFRIIEFVATASLIDKYRARSYKKFPREVYVKLLKLWEHDPRTELINPTFGDNHAPKKQNENENNNKDDDNDTNKKGKNDDKVKDDNDKQSDDKVKGKSDDKNNE